MWNMSLPKVIGETVGGGSSGRCGTEEDKRNTYLRGVLGNMEVQDKSGQQHCTNKPKQSNIDHVTCATLQPNKT
jgi:hypothetical protein